MRHQTSLRPSRVMSRLGLATGLIMSVGLAIIVSPSSIAPVAAQGSCDPNLFDCGSASPEPSCDPELFDCPATEAPTMSPARQGPSKPIPSPPRFALPSLPAGSSLDIAIEPPATTDPGSLSMAAADQVFVQERQRLREQAGLMGALVPGGASVYDAIDSAMATVAQEAVTTCLGTRDGGLAASIIGADRPVVAYEADTFPSSFSAGAFAGALAASWFATGTHAGSTEAGADAEPPTSQAFHSTEGSVETTTDTTTSVAASFDGRDDVALTVTLAYSTTRTDTATGVVTAGPTGTDTVRSELQGCPDSNGMITEYVHAMTTESSGDPHLADASYQVSTEQAVHVYVGEDAWRVREETARKMDMSVQGPIQQLDQAAGAGNDWEFHHESTWTSTSPTGSGPATLVADPSSARDDASWRLRAVSDDAALRTTIRMADVMGTVMSALPESFASDAAERYWRSGNCVDVSILEGQSGDVQPGQELQIVGQPRHRIEGTALAKPVVASLSGSGAVDPTGVAVPAPAAFEYTAGQEGEIGTVTLTSTSDRGIGSTSATFRVPRTESPGPSGTPVPTPRPTPGPPTVVQGTIEYHFAMRSIADPGHTQDLTMELHVGLRSNDGPMADSTSVVMDGDNTFRATYREEVPCAGGHEEVRAGDGRGTLTLAAPPMTGDDKLVLSLDTSPFEITDEPCPGSPADPSHDSIGYMLTACAPDHDLLTGITRGLIGLGEGGDRLDGYSFDCSDVGGDESVKLTVTVTGFLAGSAPVPP